MKPLTVFQDFIMRQFKNKSSLLKVYKDIKNMSPDIIGNIILQSVRTCSKKIIKSCFKYYTHPLYQNRNAHYPLREVILHVFIFLSAILIFRKLHTTNAIVKSINQNSFINLREIKKRRNNEKEKRIRYKFTVERLISNCAMMLQKKTI